ncbi:MULTISPECIES: DUF6344 domain-containing protein [Streptomyces]|uniref:DUF6344 domain-containing protein n=2 Tax=Streptomyces TaxID=1883 RepID=A0ABV9INT3_9ACTN
MPENRVMKLWTAIVTAFLALCTTLGFVASSGTAAAAQSGPTHTGSESSGSEHTAAASSSSSSSSTTVPATPVAPLWDWAHTRSLPPTMKQRIRAEAHGKSPSCRHRPLDDADQAAEHTTSTCGSSTDLAENAEPSIPLQR